MSQRPLVVGLLLCEQVVIEERTHNITLVNCFTMRRVGQFPYEPQQFTVFAALTDGLGDVKLEVAIRRLEDLEEIYRRTLTVRFHDPLRHLRFKLRVSGCSFPAAGAYEVSLSADAEPIGQHRFQMVPKEPLP